MIKKAGILALAAGLLLAILCPVSVQAQSKLTVLESSAQAAYPDELSFSLSAESDVNITDIRLHYAVDRLSYAEVTSEVYIQFNPGTSVSVGWTWNMRRTGGLPPGSGVEYWWTVTDASGHRVETASARVLFDDNRYSWDSLTEGEITIYWYEGDESFAQEIMATAQEALTRLAEDTGAYLKRSVRLYIYAGAQDLQGAVIFPYEWTGGIAFSRYGTIAIGIAPNDLQWGKRATVHELTHLVIHQMTFNPYNDLPTWLNEGLAMYAEGGLEVIYTAYLNRAITQNSLISVRSLSSPFSAYAEESYLSYAQSYSLIKFLIDNYGQDKMYQLLSTFAQGSSYDGAFIDVYGFDMDGLNTLWRDSIVQPAEPIDEEGGLSPAVIGLMVAVWTTFLLGVFWLWRRGW